MKKRNRVVRKFCPRCKFRTGHFVAWDSATLTIHVCAGCERTRISAIV